MQKTTPTPTPNPQHKATYGEVAYAKRRRAGWDRGGENQTQNQPPQIEKVWRGIQKLPEQTRGRRGKEEGANQTKLSQFHDPWNYTLLS